MRKKLSIIIPVYYEELVINECYRRLINVVENIDMDYELIFVNDGSKDNTLTLLKEKAKINPNVKIIDFARNFGHQIAVTAGMFEATGDAVVLIDSDLQDPPELIPEMISKWEEGFDVVYGTRNNREGETFFKLITAKYYYKFLSNISDIKIPKDTGDFRLMDKKVVDVFKNMPEKDRYVRGMISWIGFNQTNVVYNRDKRFSGETKYPLKKMINLALDGIISFSKNPFRLVLSTAITGLILSILLFIGIISWFIYSKDLSLSWISLVPFILFLNSTNMIILGVIGEYISRIYGEAKGRPLYIVKEYINF